MWRQLVTIGAGLLLVAGCSSQSPAEQGAARPVDGGDTYERAFAACVQDHGIDAEIRPNGGVLYDQSGTLTREESFALSERCERQLEDAGIEVEEEITQETLSRDYELFEQMRDCLVAEGYAVPELVSFDVYVAGREQFEHPMAAVRENHGVEAMAAAAEACPG